MNQYNKKEIVFVKHSPFMSLPYLGDVLYKTEILLYSLKKINIVFVSRKDSFGRDRLFSLISRRSKYVVCQTGKLGRSLVKIKKPIISDFVKPKNFKNLNINYLHDISWTFILSDHFTLRTKNSFLHFLPNNVGTIDIHKIK